MGSDDASRRTFGLRIPMFMSRSPNKMIFVAVVIALIGGAWTGYTVGNSPLKSLMEERDSLEAEYDSLYLAFQSLGAELASTQGSLEEEQGVNALLQDRVIELENQIEIQLSELNSAQESLVEEQVKNAILQDRVIELENQIEIKLGVIETLEKEIDELYSQLEVSQITSTRTITIDLIGTCTRVIDGDTFELLSSGKRVRLADIDAPESYEPGYDTSTIALSSWIQGETVYLDIDDIYETDIYGRYVCVVYVENDVGWANVNFALLTGEYAALEDHPNEFDPDDWETPGNLDMSEASQDTPSPEPEPEPEPPEPAWEYHSTYRGIEIQVYNPGATSYRAYFNGVWTSSASLNVLRLEIDEYLEPEPDPPAPGIYVGSINSDKYHLPSCYWAGQINPENEIWFTSKSDAESHGYVPCKVCKP